MIAALLVLGIIFLVAMIPITAILTHHQRTMAQIRGEMPIKGQDSDTVSRLGEEVSELKQLVAQQAIILDDLSTLNRRLLERTPSDDSFRQRLGS